MTELALFGGAPSVTSPHPHEPWPPAPRQRELDALARQREDDIGIRGNAGPIGALEEEFRQALTPGAAYSVAFNSGTSALLAAYVGVGIGPGDEVIGPDLTYHAALSPVYALGGAVRTADIQRGSRCIDPASAEERITERTRAIVAVHQWGHPADIDALTRLCEKYGLALVEDCSHAHGSTYRGRPVGTFGDVAAFSLQTNKAVFAGEGGMLVTSSAQIRDRAVLLGHYRDRARDDVQDPVLRPFAVTGFGLKLRMSPFNAVVARESLAAFPRLKEQRHRSLAHLSDQLRAVDYLEPVEIPADVGMGAWYGYKPLYRPEMLSGVSRSTLIAALQAEGVEVDVPSGPQLSTQPLYGGTGPMFRGPGDGVVNRPEQQPVAADVAALALSLPTFYSWPGDRDTIEAYGEAFAKVGAARRTAAGVGAREGAGARTVGAVVSGPRPHGRGPLTGPRQPSRQPPAPRRARRSPRR